MSDSMPMYDDTPTSDTPFPWLGEVPMFGLCISRSYLCCAALRRRAYLFVHFQFEFGEVYDRHTLVIRCITTDLCWNPILPHNYLVVTCMCV